MDFEVHAEGEVMQTLSRKQVDNKVTSETQLACVCEFCIKEEGTQAGGKKHVDK